MPLLPRRRSRYRQVPARERFRDQLKGFDPRLENDAFEVLLYETSVADLPIKPVTIVSPGTPIRDVLATMRDKEIGAVLVADHDRRIEGILTERDVLDRVAADFPAVADHPVRTVITGEPWVVYEIDNVATVLSAMAMTEARHVPVVDLDGRCIGIVTPRRIMRFIRESLDPPTRTDDTKN